jgi:Protein of unknown function (DUF998)
VCLTLGEMTPSARPWLRLGVAAGPLYLGTGFTQAFLREGFDVRRHALSQLANGEFGWIQTANFAASAFLVAGGALGLRRALAGSRGGAWGPALLFVYALGLAGAAVFPADPGNGFPPGTPQGARKLSQSGLLHFFSGGLGFYALTAACFIFSHRFRKTGRHGWAAFSAITGAVFFLSFAAVASGSKDPIVLPAFYVAIVWVWTWHAALHVLAMAHAPDRSAAGP